MLGDRVRLARRERRWTVEELADRVGVTHTTIRKVERGDPTVALGTAFEAATIVGVALFHDDATIRVLDTRRIADRLAVLPRAVRDPAPVDDDF
jgi:transcriptional regulator with XRE-family HTH domain